MKKLILLTILMGLTGCGENYQSDTSQFNSQTQTLQQAEVAPTVANYSLAASPRAMSAVAPLQGWNILSNAPLGANTIIEAGKGNLASIAEIRPTPKQVAEVLRGGAAGIALGIAVDQLLGAVDWVLDPANSQITYKPPATCKNSPSCLPSYQYMIVLGDKYYPDGQQQRACQDWLEAHPSRPLYWKDITVIAEAPYCRLYGKVYPNGIYNRVQGAPFKRVVNTAYDPTKPDKTLSLDVIAEQVITNADAGSLDAQVATNIAVSNILNDAEQAEPVVQQLNENASYAGVAPHPNNISHNREKEILNMKPNDPCDEISQAIKDLDETIEWRKSDLNPRDIGKEVYVNHQKRIRILNNKKDDLNRAYKIWCKG